MKIVKICYVSLIACLLAGCGLFDSEKTEFIPVKENKSDKWGFMSLDGEMIIENEFEKSPTFPMEGVFIVEEKEGYSAFLLKNRPELIKGCENLKSVGCMSNGVMPIVEKGKCISYINKKGEILFTLNPIKGKDIISVSAYFDDNNYSIIETEDHNFGYINNKGEVVISPNFSCALPFSKDGYALVCKEIDGNKNWQIIDNSGKAILKIGEKYSPCYPFVINEKLAVLLDNHFGFLDLSGKYIRCSDFVEKITDITKDGFVFCSKYKYGFMNYNGEQIIRARYSGLQVLDNGKFLANNDNEFLFLNSKGEKEVSIDGYKDIYVTPNTNKLLAKIGNNWELIDTEGKIVTKNPLSEVNIIQTTTSVGRVYSDIKNNSDSSDAYTLNDDQDIVNESDAYTLNDDQDIVNESDIDTHSSGASLKVYSNAYDGYVNVRAEPTTKAKILCTLPNGPEGAELLGIEGKWTKVRINGVEGYVWSAQVQSTPTEPL